MRERAAGLPSSVTLPLLNSATKVCLSESASGGGGGAPPPPGLNLQAMEKDILDGASNFE